MAHVARVAGTGYGVSGGKALIDGTAYNVTATKEVENVKFVTGSVSAETAGNYTSVTATITNDAFQWDKYNVKMLTVNASESQAASIYVRGLAFVDGVLWTSLVYKSGYQAATGAMLDTTQNGVLKITVQMGGDYRNYFPRFDWYAALEAKT